MNRRDFLKIPAGLALAGLAGPILPNRALAARSDSLNILCWEGYNTGDVLDPFRRLHPDAKVRAESSTDDPDMINKLRAGERNIWDLINVNQPWAREQLYPANLIKPLDRSRFEPYFETMMPYFREKDGTPIKWALDPSGKDLIGMTQRFGPFSFVVNTKKISKKMAEDQGYKLFLDPKMKGRYGVLTYDNWNVIHLCLTADFDPFRKHTPEELAKFKTVAEQIFSGAKLLSGDLVAMNTALINGEIDAYFTGGTYTASPARYDGRNEVRGITPNSGPVNGKGGVVWIEVTSLVNNPNPSTLAPQFLEYVQQPKVAKRVAFAEGTYNPVAQMGSKDTMALFDKDELDAIQWDTLEEEMDGSIDFDVNPDYDEMYKIYLDARRKV